MSEIRYINTTRADIERLMEIRAEMLREVNGLSEEYVYDEALVAESRKYFESGNQTTVLALDNEKVIGCASLSYIWIMPTFDHPTGIRAHLMNVYTKSEHRRKGISTCMIQMLIDEAREKGVTEISLDATEMGRPLYETLGFKTNSAGMVLELSL
ncbi:MAG: GNAT family N-acetyltransferase [Lachnospiraceae bacterium]|nr:GNAT family N-acetyltransferase [Lachnospiraceae bacterium]